MVVARDVTLAKRSEAQLLEATERARLAKEQAEAANKAKDKFLAALSHELRTPLTPVLLTAAALEIDPQMSPELRGDMSLIRRNIELEGRLIDDLLDLTRVSRGKLTLDMHPTDPMRSVRAPSLHAALPWPRAGPAPAPSMRRDTRARCLDRR